MLDLDSITVILEFTVTSGEKTQRIAHELTVVHLVAVRGYHKVDPVSPGVLDSLEKKTEPGQFGYLECSYGPRNVRNRFRRSEILISELKDTS